MTARDVLPKNTAAPLRGSESPLEAVRARVRRRRGFVVGGVTVALIAVVLLGVTTGDYPLTLEQLARTLLGGGDRLESYVLFQVRLPRVLMGVLVGACLGVAGALLQGVLRNPLASPDLLGISGGSSVAAVFLLLIFGVTGPILAVAAFAGGLAVAAILLLAAGRRGEAGFRLILAGIGISFLTVAIMNYLMVRSQVELAQAALLWVTGSLASTAWWHLLVVAVVAVALLPAVLISARWLPITQLGASTAAGLGVTTSRVRMIAVVSAVLLTAVTCAFAGPISFIALCAPAIARSLLGHGSIGVGTSAITGAALLTGADLVAQFAIPDTSLPVGVVTGAVGAVFLLWLLASTKGRQL
ncbi:MULTISPECIES: iron chelate uptake ABC transporter family permease subunit [unclassified Pseudoclavibacter]|uniref:FecCD family ABC transporter permease n=1 Tax=unclassified Pseudoclavibacter TaxID=2615177 RepID=UPI002157DA5A|nr:MULTISPECIES: iron ABC transporter permease [unclassified Pseudoclavibacter]